MTSRSLISDRVAAPDKEWLSCNKKKRKSHDIRYFGEITYRQPRKSGRSGSQKEVKNPEDVRIFKAPDFLQPSLKSFVSKKAKKNIEKETGLASQCQPSLSSHKESGVLASVFSSGVRKKVGSSYLDSSENLYKEKNCATEKDLQPETKGKKTEHKKHVGDGRLRQKKLGVRQTERRIAHRRGNALPDLAVTDRDCKQTRQIWVNARRNKKDKENRELLRSGVKVKAHVHLSSRHRHNNTTHMERESVADVSCNVPLIKRQPLSEKNSDEGLGLERRLMVATLPGTCMEGDDVSDRGTIMDKADGLGAVVKKQDVNSEGSRDTFVEAEGDDPRTTMMEKDDLDGVMGSEGVGGAAGGWVAVGDGGHINTDELLAELSYCEKLSV